MLTKRIIDMSKEELDEYKKGNDELAAVFSQAWKDALNKKEQ